jgi:hypothetical protein
VSRGLLPHIPSQELDAITSRALEARGDETMTVFHRVAGAYVLTATVVGLLAMVV